MNSLKLNISTGIARKHINRSFFLVFVLACTLVLGGCSSSSSRHENYSQLFLDISSEANSFFNKYAITVSLDGTEIGSIENGEEFLHSVEVVRGEHTLEFCKSGSKKPKCEKTITVTEDTSYSCKLSHGGFAIKITNESINTVVSETTDKETETFETSESSVIESAETVGIVPVAIIETENTTLENSTVESTTVETTTETIPTVVSENITDISFRARNDVKITVGCDPFSGSAFVKALDEKSISSSNIVFISENPEIATIKITGMTSNKFLYAIYPVAVGETNVYAKTVDGVVISEPLKVIVNEYVELDSIWITESCTLDIGEYVILDFEIKPEDASERKLTWSSSDTSIVTVSETGHIKGIKYGKAEVTATTTKGLSATCSVTVATHQREMKLKISRSHNEGDYIGDEWYHVAQINGEYAQETKYTITVGDTIEFYCESTEDDNIPDVGSNTYEYTVTEDDLINGFSVDVYVYVTENRGRNAGKQACFITTFSFTP